MVGMHTRVVRLKHGPELIIRPLCRGDTAAIRALLSRIATASTEDDDERIYGRWLFECLLAPAWPAILGYPAVTAARGMELALWWPATQASLHSLVWEAMYSGEVPLAGLTDTLVVVTRVVQSDHPAPARVSLPQARTSWRLERWPTAWVRTSSKPSTRPLRRIRAQAAAEYRRGMNTKSAPAL